MKIATIYKLSSHWRNQGTIIPECAYITTNFSEGDSSAPAILLYPNVKYVDYDTLSKKYCYYYSTIHA